MGGVAPETATPTGSVEVVVALVLCGDLAIFILFWFEDFSIVNMREIHVQCILNFCIHTLQLNWHDYNITCTCTYRIYSNSSHMHVACG